MNDQQPINAWMHAEERYQSGQDVRGVVTRVAQFGVFVQLEPGLEGVVYAFELGSGPAALAGIAPGQEMHLYVKNIDASRRRLELSLSSASMPGLLDEHVLPPSIRQRNRPDELPWPLPSPLPEMPGRTYPADQSTCQTCQRQVQASWKFCVYCGGSLQRVCQACGSTQPDLPDARFCYECGKPM